MRSVRRRFRKFAIKTLAPVFARVGWEAKPGEADPVAILRTQLIGALASVGDARGHRRSAPPLRGAAPPTRLRCRRRCARPSSAWWPAHADAATWDQLHAAAQAEKTPLVKDQYYALLSSAEDPALAQRALELALTDEPGETNSARHDLGRRGAASGPRLRLRRRRIASRWTRRSIPPRSAATTRVWPAARWIRR